jgi:ribonuclease P protein component
MALSKSHRLSLRLHRDRLTREGSTFYGKFFTLVSAPSSESSPKNPRFAILVSKKTASLAVDRNRIKRITSSLLELLLSTLPPQDYLIIPKRQILSTSRQDLSSDMQSLLAKRRV